MNSIERVVAAVTFRPADRVPVIPQIFAHSAVATGRRVIDYVESGETAARCQIDALRQYGYDAVFSVLDVTLEAQAIGAEVVFRQNIYPAVKVPPLTTDSDFGTLVVPDPERDGRLPELLRMAGILRREVGDSTLVVGCVQGPMTLALQFLGVGPALLLSADEPERFDRLLDYTTEVSLRFGLAQIKAGVHLPLVFEPGGCPEVVPESFFRQRIAPRISGLFRAFKAAGAAASWLHVPGETLPIFPLYREIGADIGNFDYCVDPRELLAALPADALCVDGNVKPLAFVMGTPDEIEAEARRLLGMFGHRGGFILSSGCEIPPEAKPENVAALVRATHADPGRGGVPTR